MGSSLSAFEIIKCIFSIAPVGILEKLWECFSPRNTHRTLVLVAGVESGALSATGVGVECAPDASTGRGQDTFRASSGA